MLLHASRNDERSSKRSLQQLERRIRDAMRDYYERGARPLGVVQEVAAALRELDRRNEAQRPRR